MWVDFFLNALIFCLIIYIPGFFFFRAIKFSSLLSLISAPIASISAYVVLPILYEIIGISCTWELVFIPTFIIFSACFLFTYFCNKQAEKINIFHCSRMQIGKFSISYEWLCLVVYIAVGLIVCVYVLVRNLDGPASFYNRYDNIVHLSTIRAFIDSSAWSTIHVSSYLSTTNDYAVPLPGESFYPAGWHVLVTLVCSITNSEITLACNAVNAILVSVVFPSSMFILIKSLFSDKKTVLLCGAVATMSFTAFPWNMFLKGPLYPNLLGFVLMIPFLAVLILSLKRKLLLKYPANFSLFFLAAFFAMAVTQPNAVFSAYVFAVAFFIAYVQEKISESSRIPYEKKKRMQLIALLGLLVLAAAFWALLFNLPFLQSVVRYTWDPYLGSAQGLFNAISLSFTASSPQMLLAIVTFVGVLYCLFSREYKWLPFPFIFMLIAFILSITSSGFLKQFLGGFWYTDYYRLAACAALFAIPIASMGLSILLSIGKKAVIYIGKEAGVTIKPVSAMAIIMTLFVVLNFYPNFTVPHVGKVNTAFGVINKNIKSNNDTKKEQVYSSSEQEFVEEAMSLIPNDALVINQPDDGSVFSYAINGMNTYYRHRETGSNETEESKLIRSQLVNVSTNEEVQKVLKNAGAEYVILLDQGVEWEDGVFLSQCHNLEKWSGITAINDSTQGFVLLLKKDDMCLYKIDY